MSTKTNHKALLHTLHDLFVRIAQRTLHLRMNSQRKASSAETEHDIAALLSDHIDELAASKSTEIGNTIKEQSAQEDSAPHQTRTNAPAPKTSGKSSGLSKYFRKRQSKVLTDRHIGAKIKKRAREHIYSSLRLAREGDAESARTHANIADLALKESANYMSAEDYERFIADIREHLQTIKELNQAEN